MDKQYLCIDLKSFYASVECVERGLDPMTTNLVVADPERTDKTICLAVSPSLKALGVSGRARVFEIPDSFDYIMAPPRMAKYVERSAEIYSVYLRYFSPDDIHVYSIDEAFMDVSGYLALYGCTARELGERVRQDVLAETGIPAACGIGPNLYLAKLALDITAKHSRDFFGELDADSFKTELWNHESLTDFWRIGRGTEQRLHKLGIHTIGQLALYPHPEKLYDEFGIDAEILIDHAWGYEPVTIADIKAYKPKSRSVTNAQVLGCSYAFDDALLVMKEMADASSLDLVAKRCTAESVTLAVRYERDNSTRHGGAYDPSDPRNYKTDSGGTVRFPEPTSSRDVIVPALVELFEDVVDRTVPVHNIMLNFNGVEPEKTGQLSLFDDVKSVTEERSRQEAILDVKRKFGKNALLKGIDLMPQATQQERNRLLGGHKSGEGVAPYGSVNGGGNGASSYGNGNGGTVCGDGGSEPPLPSFNHAHNENHSASQRREAPSRALSETVQNVSGSEGNRSDNGKGAVPRKAMAQAHAPRLPRPRMPLSQRAKIFIPFDPLKGYQEALRAKEREAEMRMNERIHIEDAP